MVELLCGLPTICDICRFCFWVVAKACFLSSLLQWRGCKSSSLPPLQIPLFLYFLGACFNVLSIILVLFISSSWRNQALFGRGSWWISWTSGNWGTNSQSKDNRTSYRGGDCSCCRYKETKKIKILLYSCDFLWEYLASKGASIQLYKTFVIFSYNMYNLIFSGLTKLRKFLLMEI